MKRVFNIALIAALLVSCNNYDNEGICPDTTTGDEIQFYAGDNTKTTYFEDEGLGIHWEQGDKVSIRLVDADHTNEMRRRKNYTADNTGASTTFSPITDNWTNSEMKWHADVDNCIMAYYPATNNASHTAVDIYLPAKQTQAYAGDHSHIRDLMVMKTSKQTFKADEAKPSSVGLGFYNLYSIIELTLKTNESGKVVSGVEINSTTNPLTINGKFSANFFTTKEEDETNGLKTIKGVAPTGVNNVTTTLTTPAELTAEGIKVYFVVLPGAHANGELTIKTYFTDGSSAEQKMGAIDFKMNSVYRPEISLSTFTSKPIASITHSFSDFGTTYSTPVALQEGETAPFLGRDTYVLFNLPSDLMHGKMISTIQYTTYPAYNRIKATSEGYVYLLTGSSDLLTSGAVDKMIAEGWTAITAEANGSYDADTSYDESQIFYGAVGKTYTGCLTIYERYMTEGEEYDLTRLYRYISKFQGIRPIAKTITNEVCNDAIHMVLNFTACPSGWTSNTSFSNVLINALDGEISIPVSSYSNVTLDFYRKYTETETEGVITQTNVAGSGYHKDKYLLMNLVSGDNPLSVGMPAIEGYKLTTVELEPKAGTTLKPKVCMSSTPAPNATSVSGELVEWNHKNGNKTLTINNSQSNTVYHLYAEGAANARIQAISLTYEKAK